MYLCSLNVFCCIGGATSFRLFAYVASPPSFVLYFIYVFVVFYDGNKLELELELAIFIKG